MISLDRAALLRTVGALVCLAMVFPPLTSFQLLGDEVLLAPRGIFADAEAWPDYVFAILIALAFLGPLAGAARAWLGHDRSERLDRKSTRLNSSHLSVSRMPSSA